MHGGGVHAVELVFLSLLAFVVLFAAVARKLNRPYPSCYGCRTVAQLPAQGSQSYP